MSSISAGRHSATATTQMTLERIRACLPDVLSAGELWTAERLAARAQELDPSSTDLRDVRAALLLDLDRAADALQEIQHAIDLAGRTPFRLRILAKTRSKVGDFQGAMEAATEAAALVPSDVAGHLLVSEAALRAGEAAAAQDAAETALRLAPDFAPALAALAEVDRAEGNHENEIANLEHAVALAPADPGIGTALGYAYRRAGRKRDARAMWASVLARSPRHRGAAEAILRSIGGRHQLRRMILMFCGVAFAYGIALGVGVSRGTGWDGAISDAVWVAVYTSVAALIVVRICERLSWPPGFRLMVQRAIYFSVVNEQNPTRLRAPARSALAVILLIALLAVVSAIAPPIALATEVFLIAPLFVGAVYVAGPRALRRQSRRLADLRGVRVDPSVCRCRSVRVLRKAEANEYLVHHLELASGEVMQGMSIVRCPSTAVRWLAVREGDDSSSGTSVLIRLAHDPLRPAEEPTGYL
jgi:tetratricopeptide (TPR) repeat protein